MSVSLSLRALAVCALASFAFAGCGGNSGDVVLPRQPSPGPPPPGSTIAQVRAIHASPDAGPVDIYVYAQGSTRPSTASVANAAYPQIGGFFRVPAGAYTIDVFAHGAAASGTPVLSEGAILSGATSYSIAVAGLATGKTPTLQFDNFAEPVETPGRSALVVHHASPAIDATMGLSPVGVGIYNVATAGGATPAAASTTQLFSFALTPVTAAAAGGAFPGTVNGGEYYLSPIAGQAGEPTLPTAIGFVAGAPGSAALMPLGSVAVASTLSALATPLQNKTAGDTTLAADTASTVPNGAHLTVFAIDTATSGTLIGTIDP